MNVSKKEKIVYYPYSLPEQVIINDRTIEQVDISSHCDKHLDHGITHELMLKFVKQLGNNKGGFEVDGQDGKKLYFKAYFFEKDKNYKLVCDDGKIKTILFFIFALAIQFKKL
jgi:hypothetical protein